MSESMSESMLKSMSLSEFVAATASGVNASCLRSVFCLP